MSDSEILITDNPEAKRFEARRGGTLLGFVEYIPLPGKIIATHTEVRRRFEGQGVGRTLLTGVVEQLRADGRLVQPLCPFFAAFLRDHPEHADVVDPTTPR